MATTVNSQITDSITEVNTAVIGQAPALALANLYQASAQALANAAHNATVAQQQANILGQAVTAQGVAMIYASQAKK